MVSVRARRPVVSSGIALAVLFAVLCFWTLLRGEPKPHTPPDGREAATASFCTVEEIPASPVLRGSGAPDGSDFIKVEDSKDPSVPVHLRDLGDGAPVPEVPLSLQVSEPGNPQAPMRERVEVAADEEGQVMLTERTLRVYSASKEWMTPPRYLGEEILSSGELWVYKEIEVNIRVVSELDEALGFDPKQVRLEWYIVSDMTPLTERPKGPWNSLWARAHGLRPNHLRGRPDVDGLWTGRLPRIKGVEIRGTVLMPTVLPAVTALAIPPRDADSVEVVLTFRAGRRHIHGQVRSTTGAPLAGTLVRAYVATNVRTRDLSLDRLRSLGYAVQVGGNSEGDSVLVLSTHCPVDKQGNYSLSLPQGGELLLVVHGQRHVPSRTRLVNTAQEEKVDIELEHLETLPVIRFLNESKPLRSGSILLTDLSAEPFQTNIQFPLDDAGSTKCAWLEVGREYWIIASPKRSSKILNGYITWDGRSEVNISDLPADLETFRRK